MKVALNILSILTLLLSCTGENNSDSNVKSQIRLEKGTYYLNYKLSNDTLRFQSEKYDNGGWNNTIWIITKDSIFQEDSRGLSYYLGTDRRNYLLKNDTLSIWTNSIRIRHPKIEQYLVIKSNKNYLEIVDLNENKIIDTTNRIRSDIQLR